MKVKSGRGLIRGLRFRQLKTVIRNISVKYDGIRFRCNLIPCVDKIRVLHFSNEVYCSGTVVAERHAAKYNP